MSKKKSHKKDNHKRAGHGEVVYIKRGFKIYKVGHEYIVHNTKYEFEESHSHIRNMCWAKQVVNACIFEKTLSHSSKSEKVYIYLLHSILRVCDKDKTIYLKHTEELIETRKEKEKKQSFRNKKSGFHGF